MDRKQSGAHLTMGLWAHNRNLVKIHFALISILMVHSCHRFAYAMTALLSWHVQNCDMIWSLLCMQELQIFFLRFGLRAHKPFMKWVRACSMVQIEQMGKKLVGMLGTYCCAGKWSERYQALVPLMNAHGISKVIIIHLFFISYMFYHEEILEMPRLQYWRIGHCKIGLWPTRS